MRDIVVTIPKSQLRYMAAAQKYMRPPEGFRKPPVARPKNGVLTLTDSNTIRIGDNVLFTYEGEPITIGNIEDVRNLLRAAAIEEAFRRTPIGKGIKTLTVDDIINFFRPGSSEETDEQHVERVIRGMTPEYRARLVPKIRRWIEEALKESYNIVKTRAPDDEDSATLEEALEMEYGTRDLNDAVEYEFPHYVMNVLSDEIGATFDRVDDMAGQLIYRVVGGNERSFGSIEEFARDYASEDGVTVRTAAPDRSGAINVVDEAPESHDDAFWDLKEPGTLESQDVAFPPTPINDDPDGASPWAWKRRRSGARVPSSDEDPEFAEVADRRFQVEWTKTDAGKRMPNLGNDLLELWFVSSTEPDHVLAARVFPALARAYPEEYAQARENELFPYREDYEVAQEVDDELLPSFDIWFSEKVADNFENEVRDWFMEEMSRSSVADDVEHAYARAADKAERLMEERYGAQRTATPQGWEDVTRTNMPSWAHDAPEISSKSVEQELKDVTQFSGTGTVWLSRDELEGLWVHTNVPVSVLPRVRPFHTEIASDYATLDPADMPPIFVWSTYNDHRDQWSFEILDGEHRTYAARMRGDGALPAYVGFGRIQARVDKTATPQGWELGDLTEAEDNHADDVPIRIDNTTMWNESYHSENQYEDPSLKLGMPMRQPSANDVFAEVYAGDIIEVHLYSQPEVFTSIIEDVEGIDEESIQESIQQQWPIGLGSVAARPTEADFPQVYTVRKAKAESGYGPLVYDLMLEAAARIGVWVTPDRRNVTPDALNVWAYYLTKRSDVEHAPLPEGFPAQMSDEPVTRYMFRKPRQNMTERYVPSSQSRAASPTFTVYRRGQAQDNHTPRAVVDLDGTLLGPVDYDAPRLPSGQPALSPAHDGASGAMGTLHELGWEVIVATARFSKARSPEQMEHMLQEVKEHLQREDIHFDEITTGPKPVGEVYIDDRAKRFEGDWWKVIKEITKQAVTRPQPQIDDELLALIYDVWLSDEAPAPEREEQLFEELKRRYPDVWARAPDAVEEGYRRTWEEMGRYRPTEHFEEWHDTPVDELREEMREWFMEQMQEELASDADDLIFERSVEAAKGSRYTTIQEESEDLYDRGKHTRAPNIQKMLISDFGYGAEGRAPYYGVDWRDNFEDSIYDLVESRKRPSEELLKELDAYPEVQEEAVKVFERIAQESLDEARKSADIGATDDVPWLRAQARRAQRFADFLRGRMRLAVRGARSVDPVTALRRAIMEQKGRSRISYMPIAKLRELSGLDAASFDAAMGQLVGAGEVFAHAHDRPNPNPEDVWVGPDLDPWTKRPERFGGIVINEAQFKVPSAKPKCRRTVKTIQREIDKIRQQGEDPPEELLNELAEAFERSAAGLGLNLEGNPNDWTDPTYMRNDLSVDPRGGREQLLNPPPEDEEAQREAQLDYDPREERPGTRGLDVFERFESVAAEPPDYFMHFGDTNKIGIKPNLQGIAESTPVGVYAWAVTPHQVDEWERGDIRFAQREWVSLLQPTGDVWTIGDPSMDDRVRVAVEQRVEADAERVLQAALQGAPPEAHEAIRELLSGQRDGRLPTSTGYLNRAWIDTALAPDLPPGTPYEQIDRADVPAEIADRYFDAEEAFEQWKEGPGQAALRFSNAKSWVDQALAAGEAYRAARDYVFNMAGGGRAHVTSKTPIDLTKFFRSLGIAAIYDPGNQISRGEPGQIVFIEPGSFEVVGQYKNPTKSRRRYHEERRGR